MFVIVYHSKYGSTRALAESMHDALGDSRLLKASEAEIALQDGDVVILVTPIYFGTVDKSVKAFIREHATALKPVPFHIVLCNAIAPVPETTIANIHPQLREIADTILPVGTRIRYERLGFFHKMIYRMQSKSREDFDSLGEEKIEKFIRDLKG